jgi:hypothetical protein
MAKAAMTELQLQIEAVRREAYAAGYAAAMQVISESPACRVSATRCDARSLEALLEVADGRQCTGTGKRERLAREWHTRSIGVTPPVRRSVTASICRFGRSSINPFLPDDKGVVGRGDAWLPAMGKSG